MGLVVVFVILFRSPYPVQPMITIRFSKTNLMSYSPIPSGIVQPALLGRTLLRDWKICDIGRMGIAGYLVCAGIGDTR